MRIKPTGPQLTGWLAGRQTIGRGGRWRSGKTRGVLDRSRKETDFLLFLGVARLEILWKLLRVFFVKFLSVVIISNLIMGYSF